MTTATYKIIFRGDLAPGQPLSVVKERLQSLFRLNEEQVNQLFQGHPVTLKKGLDEAQARHWCETLSEAGALVERCIEKAQEEAASARDTGTLTMKPVGADLLNPVERRVHTEADIDTRGLSIAEVGADVLQPEERRIEEDRVLDLSHLQLEDNDPPSGG